jgi:hypothetical protein
VIDMLVSVCAVAVHCRKDSNVNMFPYTLVTVWRDGPWLGNLASPVDPMLYLGFDVINLHITHQYKVSCHTSYTLSSLFISSCGKCGSTMPRRIRLASDQSIYIMPSNLFP